MEAKGNEKSTGWLRSVASRPLSESEAGMLTQKLPSFTLKLEHLATLQLKRVAKQAFMAWKLFALQFAERNRVVRAKAHEMAIGQLQKKIKRVFLEWRQVATGEHSRRAVAAAFRKRFHQYDMFVVSLLTIIKGSATTEATGCGYGLESRTFV